MSYNTFWRFFLALVIAGSLAADPAAAQGRGNDDADDDRGAEVDREARKRPKLERRERNRDDDRYEHDDDRHDEVRRDRRSRSDDRWETRRDGDSRRGPAFCRSGEGHPVHGRRWCAEKGFGLGYDNGRYDLDSAARYPDRRGSTSYEDDHREFHLYLDRKYAELAAERPLDVRWQLELRSRKAAEHDAWHERVGRRHR